MRHYLPEKWSEARIIQVLRSSDANPINRPLHEPSRDSAQTVDNADPDRQQREKTIMISLVELMTRIVIFTPHPHPPILRFWVANPNSRGSSST